MHQNKHKSGFSLPKPGGDIPQHIASQVSDAVGKADHTKFSPQRARVGRLHRLKGWISDHKPLAGLFAVLIVALIAGGIVGASYLLSDDPAPTTKPVAKKVAPAAAPPAPPVYRSPLTGNVVPDEATTKRQVTAIMLENSPDARPQSGLKDGGVVYEAIAEGGITRFVAMYQEARPGLVGPVRSLRPYYIDWLAPFDAAVAHVGGSYTALNEIRSGQYKDIDQFFNAGAYWRATDRYAPHNVYTNFDKLDELNKSKGFNTSSFTGFPRKADQPHGAPNATSIDISVSSAWYNVHYDYDRGTNHYPRTLGGEAHNDREGGRIAPKVVVAIKVPVKIGFEDGYREQMTTIGSGAAYIFQDGTVVDGTWSKAGKKDQMQFKTADGREVKLNQGQVWVTAIAPERAVTWQ